MLDDQRFASSRPDVLTYRTDMLQQDLTIAGPFRASLVVSTTGTAFALCFCICLCGNLTNLAAFLCGTQAPTPTLSASSSTYLPAMQRASALRECRSVGSSS